MQSPSWNVAVSVMSLLGLVGACMSSSEFKTKDGVAAEQGSVEWWAGRARKASNVMGCGVISALSICQTIDSLRETAVFRVALNKYGSGFGVFATVMSIIAGTITFIEGIESHDEVLEIEGAVQVLAGIVSLAGFLMEIPYLQVVGMVILIGGAIYADEHSIKDIVGTKRVLHAQITSLKSRDLFARAAAHIPSLAAALKDLEDNLQSGSTEPGHLEHTPENLSFLRGLGFSGADVELIAPSPVPVSWTPAPF